MELPERAKQYVLASNFTYFLFYRRGSTKPRTNRIPKPHLETQAPNSQTYHTRTKKNTQNTEWNHMHSQLVKHPSPKSKGAQCDHWWKLELALSLCLSGTYIIGTSENIWDILHRLSSYWSCMVHNSQLSLKIKLIVEIWYMNPFSSFNRSNIFMIINQDMVDVLVYFPISILNF